MVLLLAIEINLQYSAYIVGALPSAAADRPKCLHTRRPRVLRQRILRIIKLVHNFIWSGNNKIIRERAAKRWEEGGFKMPMVEDMNAAASVHWIRRAKWNRGQPWADWIVGEL